MSYNAMLCSNNMIRNHEGAKAWMQTPEFELYSTVVCTMSMDDKFYESSSDRINRIARLVRMVPAEFVAKLAIYARKDMHLRSVPMLLLVELSQCHSGDSLVSRATERVIQRVDDITELLSCYQWRHRSKGLKHLSCQLRKGIALAFGKFDEYQFAKYSRDDKKVTLRDAIFITHPKAKDEAQQALFHKIAHGELEIPYTWETQLSEAGQEKGLTKEERRQQKLNVWEQLIKSRRMGYMAMLRNLRNMLSAGVNDDTMQIVYDYLSDENAVRQSRQLPFRFFAAYLMMTGHRVEETCEHSDRNPYDEVIREVSSRRYSVESELYSLSERKSRVLVRKVCRRRPNPGKSNMLIALKESGLLKGLIHPWHESRMYYRSMLHTRVSSHLQKYISHLTVRRNRLDKMLTRLSGLSYRYRTSYSDNWRKSNLPKPFFAPQRTLECLENAARHSAGSIPTFDENSRVCIACDTSGSMMTPVSGKSVIDCYNLALFFGAMMHYRLPKAVIGMFATTWMTLDMPDDNIMANVLKMRDLEGQVGYATNGHKVIQWLQKEKRVMDKVIIFTDCQLWSTWNDDDLTRAWHEYKRTVAPDARLYLFDLAGYGQDPINAGNEEDVYEIAGWSDKIFDMLAALENGKSIIDEIRRIAL